MHGDGRMEEESRSMDGVIVRVIGVLNKHVIVAEFEDETVGIYACMHAHYIMPEFL